MAEEVCNEDECGLTAGRRGYCKVHYMKYWHADKYKLKPLPTAAERFWSKVEKTEGCWNWTEQLNHAGYGTMLVGGRAGKIWLAHRYSYSMANGEIAPGVEIDHKCLNRQCVNPEHLRSATKKQNMENRAGAQKNSKSGVRGVCWEPRRSKWRAVVKHNRVQVHVGTFETLAEAEAAVIAKRNELFTHNELDRTA